MSYFARSAPACSNSTMCFDASNLRYIRLFYGAFPNCDALRHELSWTHYRTLLRLDDSQARTWYMREAPGRCWGMPPQSHRDQGRSVGRPERLRNGLVTDSLFSTTRLVYSILVSSDILLVSCLCFRGFIFQIGITEVRVSTGEWSVTRCLKTLDIDQDKRRARKA